MPTYDSMTKEQLLEELESLRARVSDLNSVRESEARWRLIAECAPDHILLVNLDHEV